MRWVPLQTALDCAYQVGHRKELEAAVVEGVVVNRDDLCALMHYVGDLESLAIAHGSSLSFNEELPGVADRLRALLKEDS